MQNNVAYKLIGPQRTLYIVGSFHFGCTPDQINILSKTFTNFTRQIAPSKVYFEVHPFVLKRLFGWDHDLKQQNGVEFHIYKVAQQLGSVYAALESYYYQRAMINNTTLYFFGYPLSSSTYKFLFMKAPLLMYMIQAASTFVLAFCLTYISIYLGAAHIFLTYRSMNQQMTGEMTISELTNYYIKEFKVPPVTPTYYQFIDKIGSTIVRDQDWV